jgi:hypothetical protein
MRLWVVYGWQKGKTFFSTALLRNEVVRGYGCFALCSNGEINR